MRKKNLKKFAAVTLAATMALGSTMMVFAENGVAEGTGSYEGGEMKYPTLSVTLPTIPEGTYDYIADPNGLIAATNTAKYANSTFTGTTGLFFLTSTAEGGAKTYTEKSAPITLKNENAQDIDVTVKLEEKTAGNEIIQYADNSNFETTDTANKLYLAITDNAAQNSKVSALTSNGAAVLTTTVEGVKDNFSAGYDTTNGYGYVKKATGDLVDWKQCSFILTGAVNKNATWDDNLTFPAIKVTWSYTEHVDATDAYASVVGNKLWIALNESSGFSARPSSVTVDGTSANFEFSDAGWVAIDTPASGATVLIVIGNDTYKVVVP